MRRWIAIVVALTCALAVAGQTVAHDPSAARQPSEPGWVRAGGLPPAGTDVTLRGTLRLFHIDDFADDEGSDGYAVETSSGLVPLAIDGPPPEALNGAQVRVRGTASDGLVRVALARNPANLVKVSPAPRRRISAVLAADGQSVRLAAGTAAAAATKNVAVILFDFSDVDGAVPVSAAAAGGVAFTSPSSVADYFEEESRGAVSVGGQVLGPYQIAASKASCDPFTWRNQALSAATAAGVNLAAYTNFVYAFPAAPSCQWSGLGAMPGADSWNNGAFSLRVVAHELGHNFGVHHASSLSCTSGGVRVAISSSCSSSEYGDPFTVMGAGATKHDHATHLGQFGWLPTSEVRAVGPGGPYQLGSILDGPAASDRLLRVDRHNGTWFYLDVRSVHGPNFDNFNSGDPAVNGVTIRISPNAPTPAFGVSQTQLVDTTPGTSSYADAPLAVGSTLTDPQTGLQITTLSAGSGSATVNVVDPIAPGSPGSAQATATGPFTVALSWTAAADNYGIDHYRVLRNGTDVASPTGTSFSDIGRAPLTVYAYQVIAVDGSGNQGPAASASATTPPAGADVVKPTAPRSLKATLHRTTTRLYWTASTDAFGVAGYRVFKVGTTKPIKTVTARSVIVKRIRNARYYVRAFDAAGNVSTKSPTRRT